MEQEGQQGFFIAEDKGVELVGESEDEMEGSRGQELSLLFFHPLALGQGLTLGAVAVTAGVVRGVLVATGVALIQVAAELG